MKVLIISPVSRGGLSQNTYSLCQAYYDLGLDFVLLTNSGENEIDFFKPKFKVIKKLLPQNDTLLGGFLDYSKNKKIIRNIVKEYQPDTIHFQTLLNPKKDAEFINYLQNLSSKKIKVVYSAAQVLPYQSSYKVKKHYAKIYSVVDKIITPTKQAKRELSAMFSLPEEIIDIIPFGNSINLADQSPEISLVEAREILNIDRHDFCCLFFGSILPYRGLDILLKAMAYLKDHPKIKLIIAGEMKDKNLCEDLIDIFKIRDSVYFYLDYIPIKYIGQYFYASDLVVLPYRQIYQSGVAHLASAFNLPILTTKVGGMMELIKENENGWLVSSENPKELAQKIFELYRAQPKELKKVGKNAFGLVKNDCSWKYIAKQTIKTYLD